MGRKEGRGNPARSQSDIYIPAELLKEREEKGYHTGKSTSRIEDAHNTYHL